jgi:hypothetical protein
MTAVTSTTHIPARPARRHRSVVGRTLTGVTSGTVTVARFTGHFVVACVSVAVLGADTEH